MDGGGGHTAWRFCVPRRTFSDTAHDLCSTGCRKLLEGDLRQLQGQLRAKTDLVASAYEDRDTKFVVLLVQTHEDLARETHERLVARGKDFLGFYGITQEAWKELSPKELH